jgi:23S rRNA (cytosine1962-C5)-methyltransferase
MLNPKVTLIKGRAKPFWFGCPVVFSGSIATVQGNPGQGDVVDLADDSGQMIGWGFYNPRSSYRVRIVGRAGDPETPDEIIGEMIRRAWTLRRNCNLPNSDTNVFRLFNSEGDGLSGITIDVFDRTAVVMESAFWTSGFRRQVAAAIIDCLGSDTDVLFRVVNSVRALEGMTAVDAGESAAGIVCENGLKFSCNPGHGQKTGFYADQRENRLGLRRFVRGAAVLDLFCFSGGFAINAVKGGAAEVTAVDSSAEAIEAGRANALLNGAGDVINFVEDDAVRFLEQAGQYDVVVCDPPKLAQGRNAIEGAMKRYFRLNLLAIKAVRPGGMLLTCSCSSVVRRDDFVDMIRDAAGAVGRDIAILNVAGTGPDHPVSPAWTEGEYLKAVTIVVR